MAGSLPPEIRKLKAATLIDLSMNQFLNGIRREIGGLRNLVHLSLRHNKLQGSIPDSVSNMVGGPFKNLSSQFFIYNEALCGSSRFSVPPCPTSSKHKSKRKKLLVLFLFLGLEILFVPIIFVFVWIWYWRGKRAPQLADPLSTKKRETISYYELLQAMDDLSESNLIGSGSFGSVYKGILKSGTVIAVKVFNLQVDAAFKSFDTECEVLRSLRHRDLVKVITSCSNLDFKALILEYMPNGSLEKYLYLHNYFLDTN
ncbi:probable LRR receptor-like serine/threonine-protein kinase At3g47570 [Capsicum annuum]|uniref:probable LRR receptor-like serine/threonine-protein kinase At3g47570 n=1 Tax=Capsicum annuum TaxID=4072 RepID=UPI001FB18784|nr:probable LRR receptor-like serine/threonine-protein kinase At3g47570 [Capsicum annuum]